MTLLNHVYHSKKDKYDFCKTFPDESLCAKLRHAYYTYRFWNPKNDVRHIREMEFRLNDGSCENHMMDRIKSLLRHGLSVPQITMKQSFESKPMLPDKYGISLKVIIINRNFRWLDLIMFSHLEFYQKLTFFAFFLRSICRPAVFIPRYFLSRKSPNLRDF